MAFSLPATKVVPQGKRRRSAPAHFNIPGYANFGNLRILVSPYLKYNLTTKETDIIMFNSKNLGALIVDEEPHVREWDEPAYGINNVAIEESYGFGVLNEGQALCNRPWNGRS